MKSRVVSLSMVTLAVVLGLVQAELIYRIFEPDEQRRLLRKESSFPSSLFDERLGWKIVPGRERVLKHAEFEVRASSNAHGMRYREVGPKKRFRVAVLGDSFTWGWGVEDEERFTDIIERELDVDMLNFGVNGYALTQYYLLLDKVLSFKPDLVLVVVGLSNDFEDTLNNYGNMRYRPYAALEDGKLVIQGLPVPNITQYVTRHDPLLVRFALGRLLYLHLPDEGKAWVDTPPSERAPPIEGMQDYDIYRQKADETLRIGTEIAGSVLQAMHEKLDEAGIPLLIYPATTSRDTINPIAYQRVSGEVRRQSIPLVEVKQRFAKTDYLEEDGHWNAKGQRKAADDILPEIRSRAEAGR